MRMRARLGRLPLVSGLIALSMVTVGLVGPVAAATPTAATPSTALEGSLVGTWERVTRCKELVHALEKAGLEEFVLDNVVGNGFLPGVTSPDQIADPKHPCKGAVPRVHAHFFTADGQFGSLDFTGQQVDAGIYTIIEPGTVVIDNGDFRATFHYRFTDHGDTIRLYPIAPDCVCDRPVGRGGGLPRQEVDARELGDPRTHERPRVGDRRRVMASRDRPRPRDLILR
jgi:hypothetical protein